jgi:hypothetical protein
MAVSRLVRACIFLAFLGGGLPASAQSRVVEDRDVGVKLSIPAGWKERSRSNDFYVDCAPGKDDRGRPACYFTIRAVKAPPDQQSITDADRAKWRGWENANGMRPTISARDVKIAGFPAFEIVSRSGSRADENRMRRVFVLVPGAGVFDSSFIAMGDGTGDQYDRYERAVAAALETLKPSK